MAPAMDIRDIIREVFLVDAALQQRLLDFGLQFGIFLALVVVSLVVGRLVPAMLQILVNRLAPTWVKAEYEQVITPYRRALMITVTLGLVALNLRVLQDYPGLFAC
jgi:hypothetical protein